MKIVTLWALLILCLGLPTQPALAQTGNRFEKVSCDTFDLSQHAGGAVEGKDVQCGYVIAPERHDQPNGPTIKLAIVIIKSTSSQPAPDPLLLTQGGPGGSSIEIYASLANPDNKVGQMLRADRDLIVFEQRGTRYSQPFLFCAEAFKEGLDNLEKHLSDEQSNAMYRRAYDACKTRLQGQGIDLAAYNSLEDAADIATLAQTLDYKQLNFYGVSYGTALGQHLMRQFPQRLRAVVLDGIVPLQVNPNRQFVVTINRSFSELFKACAANPDCNRAYPNLEQVFFETVARLNQTPAHIPLTDFQTRRTYNTVMDGNDLIDVTVQLLYATEAIPLLPKFIYEAHAGVFDLLPVLMSVLLSQQRTFAEGMYMAVECAEYANLTVDQLDLKGVRPQLVPAEKNSIVSFLQVCADWQVPQLDAAADAPLVSDIPALLYSGHFDPVTPPANGALLAQTLSHAYAYVFPANGHGALLSGECSARIMRDFLNNPSQAPDAGCVNDPPAPVFLTPANTLMSPGATYLMRLINRIWVNLFNPPQLVLVLLPPLLNVLLLLGLIVFPPVWFIGWLINWLRRRPMDKRRLARLGPWVEVLLVVLVVTFVALQAYSFVTVAFEDDLFGIISGLSRRYAWIFVFPWLTAITAVAMAVLAVRSWRTHYWGRWARVYYSFTALLAVAYTLFLVLTGMLTVLFG